MQRHNPPSLGCQDLLGTLRKSLDGLPPQQQRVARYVLAHHDRAAFLSTTELARAVGVSQPTVVRFCQKVGFQGYPQFGKALQNLIRHELTTKERFNLSLEEFRLPSSSYPQSVLVKEMQSLRDLAENFPLEAFDKAVHEIAVAEKVFVVGMRGSSGLARSFSYFLQKVKRPVRALIEGGTSECDVILDMGEKDVTVAMAFPRYPRETIEVAHLIHRRGGRIIGITDGEWSPLYPLASTSLIVNVSFTTLFDSYSAVLCLLNMLVTEVGRANSEESRRLIEDYETLAREIRVFHRGQDTQRRQQQEEKRS